MPVAPLRALASRRAAAALGFLIAAVAPWAQAVLPREVAASLAAANIPASQVSVWVQDLGLPQPELRHNAEEPRNPASTIKLVTTYAALEMLGPTFTWKTEAWTSAPLVGDVLQGDLEIGRAHV